MRLSDIENLMTGVTVPTENPLRAAMKKNRGKEFKTALKVALKDKKTGNPTEHEDPDAQTGGDKSDIGTLEV